MDYIIELFKKYGTDEYHRFDRINNPPYKDSYLCGLIKLYELCGERIEYTAELDGLILNRDSLLKERLTEDDAVYLIRCGILYWRNQFYVNT